MNLMVIFLAMGIAIVIIRCKNVVISIDIETAKHELDRSCADPKSKFSDIDSIYKKGDSIMCTSTCPCIAGMI